MKLKLFFYAWPVLAVLTVSCADDNSDETAPKPATLQTTLASGEWEVESYTAYHPNPPLVEELENPVDHEDLNDLPNYSFSFKPKDLIIATAYGSTDPVGIWAATKSEAGAEMLNMKYPYGPLDGLNGNWTVTEHTENKVSLKLRDEVWGGDDLIVFLRVTGSTPDDNN
jgi:hypothetical protein